MLRPSLTTLCLLISSTALAQTPQVATDIAPVHALAAQVMKGVGTPDLILPPGASPHGYALRPSEAEAMAQADLVIWVGHDLTPWLEKPLETIAASAHSLQLLELPGSTLLENRNTALLTPPVTHEDDHDHEAEGHEGEDHADAHDEDHDADHKHEAEHDDAGSDDHEHNDHGDADHDHADDHGADDHDHGHDHGHDHAEGAADPHAWLDPQNAIVWLDGIANELARIDPENAATYRANAAEGQKVLSRQIDTLSAQLAPVRGTPFVVFHDAYQYFETRFGLQATGAVSLGDASRPSPARIAVLQKAVADGNIRCALAEPQFNPGLLETVFDGTGVSLQVIDPLGTELTLGPDMYPALIQSIADSLVACADGS